MTGRFLRSVAGMLALLTVTGCAAGADAFFSAGLEALLQPETSRRCDIQMCGTPAAVAARKSTWVAVGPDSTADLGAFLARTRPQVIRVHRRSGPPVVLHQPVVLRDVAYGTYFPDGVALADILRIDMPRHPDPLPFNWAGLAAVTAVLGGFWLVVVEDVR